jgi:hypothetical protein
LAYRKNRLEDAVRARDGDQDVAGSHDPSKLNHMGKEEAKHIATNTYCQEKNLATEKNLADVSLL